MTAATLAPPPPAADPTTPPPKSTGRLRPAPEPIGVRYVPPDPAGEAGPVLVVPLYATDLIHPEEGDQVMNTALHVLLTDYLYAALLALTQSRPDVRVCSDRRVDFQVAGLQPLGPDVFVVVAATRPDDPSQATFRVRASGGVPLLAVEVLSDSTRTTDTGSKVGLYHRAGVRYHLMIDRLDDGTCRIDALTWADEGYSPLEPATDGTFWLPELGGGLRAAGDRVLVVGLDGVPVPSHTESLAETAALRVQAADTATALAAADQRAVAADLRAAAAEAALQVEKARLAELEAELRRLRDGT